MIKATGADGKQYEMYCIPCKYVFGWLFSIDAARVSDEARPVVQQYKLEHKKIECAECEKRLERLNKAYPRTQPLVLNVHRYTGNGQWTAWVDGNSDKIVFLLSWETVLGTYEFAEKNEKDLPDNHITINQIDLNNWEFDEDSNCIPVSYEVSLTFCGKQYILYFKVIDLQKFNYGWDLESSGCEGDTLFFDSVKSYFENYTYEADRLIKLIKECWDDFINTEGSPYNYMGIKE